jgi:hypothetical protein
MIPLNPDSDQWLVTFCFRTLKYRDIGLYMPYIYGIYTAYMRVPALYGTALLGREAQLKVTSHERQPSGTKEMLLEKITTTHQQNTKYAIPTTQKCVWPCRFDLSVCITRLFKKKEMWL